MAKKKTSHQNLETLKRHISAKVDDLDRRMTLTEDILRDQRAAVEPAKAPFLPVLRRKRATHRKTGT